MPRFLTTVAGSLAIFCAVLPAHSQTLQRVTLRTGFTIEARGIEAWNSGLVLHTGDGQLVIERSEVERIEDLPWIAPPLANSAPIEQPASVEELLRRSAARQGLPREFVESVAETESALRPEAVSPKGARGVMQLMPATAAALGVNPAEPAENIDGGAKLLRDLLLRYQDHPDQVRLALAAYNAGPGAVARYSGVPPYRETNAYVERVLSRYRAKQAANGAKRAVSAGETADR